MGGEQRRARWITWARSLRVMHRTRLWCSLQRLHRLWRLPWWWLHRCLHPWLRWRLSMLPWRLPLRLLRLRPQRWLLLLLRLQRWLRQWPLRWLRRWLRLGLWL